MGCCARDALRVYCHTVAVPPRVQENHALRSSSAEPPRTLVSINVSNFSSRQEEACAGTKMETRLGPLAPPSTNKQHAKAHD